MLMKDCVVENLKPCPFCGGEAKTDYDFNNNRYYVFCRDCDARVYDYNSEERVIKEWNKRIYEE